MAFKETLLQEAMHLFKQRGVKNLSKTDILKALSISDATYDEYFKNKEDLFKQAVLEDQKANMARDEEIAAAAENPVIELLTKINIGVEDLKSFNKLYLHDLVNHYPAVLELSMKHMESYSYHKTYSILNDGVQQGLFRKDINMEIVTRVMLANINLLLNHESFPPERYELNEVFRSIYLYYIRGLCTEQGMKFTEKFFSQQE